MDLNQNLIKILNDYLFISLPIHVKHKGCFIEVININDVKFFHVHKEIESTNVQTEKTNLSPNFTF